MPNPTWHTQVAVGVHRHPLTEPKQGLLLRDVPPLNWRALLGDNAFHGLPNPLVEFQLFETGAMRMVGCSSCSASAELPTTALGH